MAGRIRDAEADLQALAQNPAEFRDGSLGVNTPFDMPAYVRAWRVMQANPDHDPNAEHGPNQVLSETLLGHKLSVDMFVLGVKIHVHFYQASGAVKVMIEDGDGMTEVGRWER